MGDFESNESELTDALIHACMSMISLAWVTSDGVDYWPVGVCRRYYQNSGVAAIFRKNQKVGAEIVSLDYGLLRTLHRMLRQLTDIGEQMEKGPRKVRIVRANEANFAQALEDAKTSLLDLRKASDGKQLQLAEREAKVEDLKAKLNACDSNKEFQLLKDRIAADIQANSVLQDEILEQLERIDELTEEVGSATKNHEKSQVESARISDEVALELKALDGPSAEQRGLLLRLDEYQHIIFVSANAIRFGMDWIGDYWPQLPVGLNWYTVGEASAKLLADFGVEVKTPAVDMSSEGLLALPELVCRCCLFSRKKSGMML